MPHPAQPSPTRADLLLWTGLLLAWCVGILGRGYWTPDEPREADIAWRMSWQTDKAVPLLAGEAFCEKPPLTYWVAGASIAALGKAAWAARLPNLLYALLTAVAVAGIARRAAGKAAAAAAAGTIATLLLSYQVAIWLATDAPLVAMVAVALLGLYRGFHATSRRERWLGYTPMHAAMALGFLSKSAAGWMVPVLALVTLVAWERRWREFTRIELLAGVLLQAVAILSWVAAVYFGPDGTDHLRVFFWNNLVGRFTHLDAPAQLQYATGHRNTPGKYLLELPVYLWPWTVLAAAAARRAWRCRDGWLRPGATRQPAVRFALAVLLPTLAVLSLAATARNIYLAPALPGVAVLIGWWTARAAADSERADRVAVKLTALLLLLAAAVLAAATATIGADGWTTLPAHAVFVTVAVAGLAAAVALAMTAARLMRHDRLQAALLALLLAYCSLLIGPASQIYRGVDAWQNLGAIGRAVQRDTAGRPLLLFAPDETTRAFVDLYARSSVSVIAGPVSAPSLDELTRALRRRPDALVLTQAPGREWSESLSRLLRRVPEDGGLPWIEAAGLRVVGRYALPNGRRYLLLGAAGMALADSRRYSAS